MTLLHIFFTFFVHFQTAIVTLLRDEMWDKMWDNLTINRGKRYTTYNHLKLLSRDRIVFALHTYMSGEAGGSMIYC